MYLLSSEFLCWVYVNLYTKCCRKKKQKTNKNTKYDDNNHIYDLKNDIIKIKYFRNNWPYIICLHRSQNVPQIKQKIMSLNDNPKVLQQLPILSATLNNKVDITDRLNSYIGYDASHVKIGGPVKIRWFLNSRELHNFNIINVMTSNHDEDYYDVNNDIIL
jgi:hypothetical protein